MCVYTTLPLLYKHIVSLDTEDMLCLGSGQMASPRGVNIIYLGLLLKGVEIHIREFKSWTIFLSKCAPKMANFYAILFHGFPCSEML